jgi:phosphoribosylformylglycinamidine synthase
VIDEAIRNCVAVGADPARIALLDNFCWGNTERPETLGSLVLAAQACHDVALAYGAPFISGKDSLNNEYSEGGTSLAIPPTLLISAIGQVPDVRACVTMDLKEPGNALFLLGETRAELGGSLWSHIHSQEGSRVPRVNPEHGLRSIRAIHAAMEYGLLRSCHDLSEGGLAVALAEMALAGNLGASVSLVEVPREPAARSDFVLLFSESPSRFVVEVPPESVRELAALWKGLSFCRLGEVTGPAAASDRASQRLIVHGLSGSTVVDAEVARLKSAWQVPLRW